MSNYFYFSRICGAIESYGSNNLNQYTQMNGNPLTYDANGNLVQHVNPLTGQPANYDYDYENRLSIVNSPSSMVAEYKYDPLGRRITKSQVLSQESQVTNFIYDGDRIIAEYDASGTLLKKRVFGPGIDEILSTIDYGLSTTYYSHFDALGSITDITDSSGSIVLSQRSIGNRYMFIPNGVIQRYGSLWENPT